MFADIARARRGTKLFRETLRKEFLLIGRQVLGISLRTNRAAIRSGCRSLRAQGRSPHGNDCSTQRYGLNGHIRHRPHYAHQVTERNLSESYDLFQFVGIRPYLACELQSPNGAGVRRPIPQGVQLLSAGR